MPLVADVIDALAQHGGGHLAGPAHREAAHAVIVDDLRDPVDDLGAAVLVPTAAASRRLRGARLAGFLSAAAGAGAVLVVLDGRRVPTPELVALADRAGIAVASGGHADLTTRFVAVSRALSSAPADAFARLFATYAAIQNAERDGADAVLRAGSRALGSTLRRFGTGVAGDGDRVAADRVGPVEEIAASIAGATVSRIAARQRQEREGRARARGDLVLGLVTASAERLAVLTERAGALGVAVERWHRAVWFEPRGDRPADPLDLAALGASTLEVAHATLDPDRFAATLVDAALVVFQSTAERDDVPLAETRRIARELLAEIRAAGVQRRLLVGIGGGYRGATAFRASAAEARGALGLAASAPDGIAAFDATGMHAMMVDWLASETSRRMVDDLLGPLDDLGERRGAELVRTLGVYLDTQGSLQRSGEALSLHRNAVAYRLRQIRDALRDLDLDDPDQRLALQVACRARRIMGA